MTDVLRIFGLWRGRAGWLVAGIVVSLAALAAGVSMMALGGAMIGAASHPARWRRRWRCAGWARRAWCCATPNGW